MFFGNPQNKQSIFGTPNMATPQTPVNIPQTSLGPQQMPMQGAGPSDQMNPMASIIGNMGGPVSPQGFSAGQDQSGIMQILNAILANSRVNGSDPASASGLGGVDMERLLAAMKGGM